MKYAGVINNDVVNGYDVCVSYWCQGCRFRCPGCHNPQTWDFEGGNDIAEEELIENLLSAISKNGIQRNFSILGGEPLCPENAKFTAKLIKAVVEKYPSIMIFIWTGYELERLFEIAKEEPEIDYILNHINILVDGQFDIKNRDISLAFRGSKNQRVIDMKQTLINKTVVLYCE